MDILDRLNMLTYGFWERKGLDPSANTGIEREFTFTSKTEYLKWVANWKAEYSDLSDNIRNARATCKSLQQDNDAKASETQSKLSSLGLQARGMLLVRRLGKARSWELKQQIDEAVLTGAVL